ncbi:MAG: phosphate acyltransferase PlsX [Oscillospiraceae bacterium]|jgi:glycerol-3-phosphate acyltransferase PlsX|nr:phosphate acyltransferase PlsX [Oscillospiraceae bacterium]
MKIIVDAMGGDNAPGSAVIGTIMAAEEFGVEACLVGKGEKILEVIHENGYGALPKGIEIVDAPEVIEMTDDPSSAVREKKNSSMAVGLAMLAEGVGDAFVSAGSTGALLSGSTLVIKRIRGIRRAALPPLLPTKTGKALLIDCGANVECTPEYLVQFAYMGSFYVRKILNIPEPRVGLLNVGSEETKGTALQKETYKLLKEAGERGSIRFIGNVEGRDIMFGGCDVVVADGYSGNILLKSIEGLGLFFVDALKEMFTKNTLSKLASLAVKDSLRDLKKLMDYNETGGTPLLGISKPVIKAHGSATAFTIRSAIKQAIEYTDSGIVESIQENIEYMKVEQGEQ